MFGKNAQLTEEQRLQIEEGKRLAAEEMLSASANVRSAQPRPKLGVSKDFKVKQKVDKQPKGHEALLRILETNGASIVIEKCDGTTIEGSVKHSDHYTISVQSKGSLRVVFKHDISEFRVIHSAKTAPSLEIEGAAK